jgi:hypothetical protein|tara:strand:+ start:546 stop:1352 length:807 start_codon:yes stop_codon:yes gene_type:complete
MALTLLNQIFYNSNKFDVEPKLCEEYMFFQEYLNNVKPLTMIKNDGQIEIPIENTIEKEIPPALFTPKKQDKLFWGLYVLHIGEAEYHMIGNKHKNVELEEKKKILDYVLKNRGHIKTTAKSNGVKITNTKMQVIESDLMVDSKTTWYSFWIMCFYYKINVLLVQNNIYMEFKTDSVYDTYLVERDDDFHITIDFTKMSKQKEIQIKKNKLLIDPFVDKILRGVSYYKIPELEKMAQILHVIPEMEKPKKGDWYDIIIKKLVSMRIQN